MAGRNQKTSKRGEPSPRFSFPLDSARASLLAWFRQNPASHPWRLDFKRTDDPYFVWISEIMLQQTVIKAVLPVYARFVRKFPDVYALSAASEDELRMAVRGLGYYRRFNFLHRAARELVAAGTPVKWPQTFGAWKELPGIGDYTAAAVSSIAFDYPAAAVDGNVDRVIARLAAIREPLVPGPVKKQISVLANQLLERRHPGRFNEAMMELGQTVCRPTKPECPDCPFMQVCLAHRDDLTSAIPAAKPKMQYIDIKMRLVIARQGKQVFLHRRPGRAKFLRDTTGFATDLVTTETANQDGGPNSILPKEAVLRGQIKHSITKHKIVAEVFETNEPVSNLLGEWLHEDLVEENLISNLDRKAWRLAHKEKAAAQ